MAQDPIEATKPRIVSPTPGTRLLKPGREATLHKGCLPGSLAAF